MKKHLRVFTFLAALLFLSSYPISLFAARAELVYDGDLIQKADLRESGGDYYLSLKAVAAMFNGKIQFYPIAGKIVLQTNNQKITINNGSRAAQIGDNKIKLPSPAKQFQGNVYVPVEFLTTKEFEQAVDCKVHWDSEMQMLSAEPETTFFSPRIYNRTHSTRIVFQMDEDFSPEFKKKQNVISVDVPKARIRSEEILKVNDGIVQSIRITHARKGADLKITLASNVTSYAWNMEEDPPRLVISVLSPEYFKHPEDADEEEETAAVPEAPAANAAPATTEDPQKGSANLPTPAATKEVAKIPVPAPVSTPDLSASTAKAEKATAPVPPALPVPASPKRKKVSKTSRIKKIVVDAGHGGKDAGAVGRGGTKEKDINLLIALELARILRIEGGYEVVLTRQDDTFVSLIDRSLLANEKKADLFISIHCNASMHKKEGGFEIYYLAEDASDPHAEEAEKMENSVIELEGPLSAKKQKLQELLFSMAQTEFINESSLLCHAVEKSVKKRISIESRGVKQANFHVLHGAQMPSVLIETAFITNSPQEQKLRQRKFRSGMVDAVLAGVQNYEKELAKLERKEAE